MYEYDEEVLNTFLENQTQLFSEEVADSPETAGTDIAGMSDDELLEQSEVFSLPSGRFLIVEG